MASRRKRGPVALRPWLWPGLPLLDMTTFYGGRGKSRQLGDVPKLDSVQETLRGTSALGRKATSYQNQRFSALMSAFGH